MEKFNPVEFVTFSREGKKILANSKLFVKDAKKRQKYVDDKPVQNEYDGTVLIIQFDRNQIYANSEFKLFVDDVYDPEEIIDKDVKVSIESAKIYARSAHNFATMQVSLHGSVEFVNNEDKQEDKQNVENDSEIPSYTGALS